MKKTFFFLVIGYILLASQGLRADEGFYPNPGKDAYPGYTYEHKEVASPSYGERDDVDSAFKDFEEFESQYKNSQYDDPYAASASEDTQVPIEPSITVAHDEFTKSSIRDRVKVLRQERRQMMPYLDRGYIRSSVHPKKVQEKMNFIAGGEKKLRDLIERAIRVHMPAKAAKERIALARRRIIVAIRELFPEISFEYMDRDGALSGGPFNSRGFHWTMKQPLFRGGILWNTLLQERAGLKESQKEYDRIIMDIIRDVSEAYFEYNRALQVNNEEAAAIGKMQHYAEMSEEKSKQGLISEIEHLNVQSLFSQMKYDYETAKQELELARLDMQNYLSLEIGDEVDVAGLYDIQEVMTDKPEEAVDISAQTAWSEDFRQESIATEEMPDLKELVDLAYQNRAELQVEAARLAQARLEERIQWAEMLPHADLVMEFGKLGEAYDVIDTVPNKQLEVRIFLELNWNAGGNTLNYQFENKEDAPSLTLYGADSARRTQITTNTFSLGLFDGLDALADAKEAEAEKLERIVELENAEKEVVQDVKKAYFDYQKALIQMKSSIKRLNYRDRIARVSKHRLDNNEIQVSEYMQSEIEYLREKIELHKALTDYFAAKASLNRAVGVNNYMPIEESYGKS